MNADQDTREFHQSILVFAKANRLLSSALCELLRRDDSRRILQVSTYDDLLSAHYREEIALVIAFISYPVTTFLSNLSRIPGDGVRKIIVVNQADRFAMHHFADHHIDGIISSDSSYKDFLYAINAVTHKRVKYISPNFVQSIKKALDTRNPFSYLSTKELDVALSIVNGKRPMDIASELNISCKTVSTYKSRIYRKLEVDNDSQLIRMALLNDVGMRAE